MGWERFCANLFFLCRVLIIFSFFYNKEKETRNFQYFSIGSNLEDLKYSDKFNFSNLSIGIFYSKLKNES